MPADSPIEIYREILDNTRILAWLVDDDGVVLGANPAVEALVGLLSHEMAGSPIRRFLHSDDADTLTVLCEAVARGDREAATLVMRVREASGWRHVRTHISTRVQGRLSLVGRDITDDLQTYSKDMPWERLLAGYPDVLMVIEPERLKVISAAGDTASLFDMPSDALVGRQVSELFASLVPEVEALESMPYGEFVSAELELMVGLERRWVEWRGARIRSAGGDRYHGLLRDRTGEYRATLQSSRLADLLGRLSDQAPGALFQLRVVRETDFHCDYVSQSIEQLTGVPAAQYYESVNAIFDYVEESRREAFIQELRGRVARRERLEILLPGRRPVDGKAQQLLVTADPSVDPEGHDIYVGIAVDVTDRERQRILLDATQSAGGVGGWSYHPVSGDVQVTPTTKEIFGIERSPLELSELLSVVDPGSLAPLQQAYQRLMKEGHPWSLELQAHRSDGELIWLASTGFEERDASGQQWIYGTVRDITRQKERERELEESRQLALDATRAKSRFLANMSHEIRTPMNGIIGMADLLRLSAMSDEQQEYVGTIQSCAESLLRIINDVLDLSRIEASRMELATTRFEVRRMAHDTVQVLSAEAHRKGLQLLVSIAPDMPSYVVGDSGRIGQILINLLGNAVKFTDAGYVRLDLSWDAPSRALVATVSDTGPGIPADRLDEVFRAFEQADGSIARRYGGTGLGLTISLELARAMGGGIRVVRSSNAGTVVEARVVLDAAAERHHPEPREGTAIVFSTRSEHSVLLGTELMRRGVECELLAPYERPMLASVDWVFLDADVSDLGCLRGISWSKRVILISRDAEGELTASALLATDAVVARAPVFGAALERLLAEETAPLVVPQRGASRPPGAAPRVLLAEDNAINSSLTCRILERSGYQVDAVNNGRAALRRLEGDHDYDVVLMDVQMPAMDGLSATYELRARERAARRPRVPVIALTANAMRGDESRCYEAGMDHYLAKPIRADVLIAAMGRLIGPVGESGFDAQRLEAFTGDRDTMDAVLEAFEIHVGPLLQSVEQAADANTLMRAAHTLKSGLLAICAEKASTIAANVESLARDDQYVPARDLIPSLSQSLDRLQRDVRQWRASA